MRIFIQPRTGDSFERVIERTSRDLYGRADPLSTLRSVCLTILSIQSNCPSFWQSFGREGCESY
jgi:hypothetical protein